MGDKCGDVIGFQYDKETKDNENDNLVKNTKKIKDWWKRINYVEPEQFSIGALSIIEKWMVRVIAIFLPINFFLVLLIILYK